MGADMIASIVSEMMLPVLRVALSPDLDLEERRVRIRSLVSEWYTDGNAKSETAASVEVFLSAGPEWEPSVPPLAAWMREAWTRDFGRHAGELVAHSWHLSSGQARVVRSGRSWDGHPLEVLDWALFIPRCRVTRLVRVDRREPEHLEVRAPAPGEEVCPWCAAIAAGEAKPTWPKADREPLPVTDASWSREPARRRLGRSGRGSAGRLVRGSAELPRRAP